MKSILTFFFLNLAYLSGHEASSPLFEDKPYHAIQGDDSGLDRPEGIAFSPDGRYIAIVNAQGNSVCFYEFEESNTPIFILSGPETGLYYPHDVSFSPDGKLLAVANRGSKSVIIYGKESGDFAFNPRPLETITQRSFTGVGAVAFSPTESLLAIADTFSNRVLIYLINAPDSRDSGIISRKLDSTSKMDFPMLRRKSRSSKPLSQSNANHDPICVLKTQAFHFIDGLNFSPDGKLLGVTSHGNHTVHIFKREANDDQLFTKEPVFSFNGNESSLTHPHSLEFHPNKDFLVITSAGGYAAINIYQNETDSDSSFISTPIQTINVMLEEERCAIEEQNPQECGAKGVAISPDGKVLAVCVPNLIGEDAILFFRENE